MGRKQWPKDVPLPQVEGPCSWCGASMVNTNLPIFVRVPIKNAPLLLARKGQFLTLHIAGAERHPWVPDADAPGMTAGGGLVFKMCTLKCAGEVRTALVTALAAVIVDPTKPWNFN